MEPSLPEYEVQKEKLVKSTEDLRKALEIEIDNLKESAGEWGKVILVAGGAVFLTYSIIRIFTKKKPKQKHANEATMAYQPVPVKHSNILGRRIMEQIAFFILAIAKQKLLQYLEEKKADGKQDA